MRALSVITLLVVLFLPTVAFAEIQTFTATHTYILGDHDSKDDARQRCLLEAKRKILEQAGVYIESASEVKDLQLTRDKITSFAAAVMQVKDTKEEVGFQQGHMTLTLTTTAQVDLAEMRKQLAARQVDTGVREDVATQKERLKRLEAQLEAMQRQQGGEVPGQMSAPPTSDISPADLQTQRTHAAQGNTTAQVELGLRYALGNGVPQDYAIARHWYENAVSQGHASAQSNLGVLYANGHGVPQDYAMARQWFEKAAAQGDALGQYKLGVLYDKGQGVPQDYAMARQWWEKAAAQGFARAQVNLGVLYERGRGVPQDYVQARQWYEKAAAQGNAAAQYLLGLLYLDGKGVPQDYAMAREWFEKAAAQGDALGQFWLGTLYYRGRGVPKDDVRAYIWFNLAAANSTGDKQKLSKDARDEIARRMTPAQVAEAQRLASRCQAQQFKGC
jgi:TPR repeat protein